jgi:hypothetical protein
MRLCTCGHRDARHDQLDGEVRGECMACSCTFFEDVRSSIEEEIGLGQIVEIGETPALRKLREAFPFAPVATEQEIAAHLAAGNDIVRVVRPPEVDAAVLEPDLMTPGMPDPCQPIGCDNGFHLPGCVYAERDREPLESFNAWRCYICGMRSYRQETCCRPMDPVRVEIHSRDSP